MIAKEHFLCLRPSFVIKDKSPIRLSDHCTRVISCLRRIIVVYRVSSSQYNYMTRIRCFVVERVLCE